MKCELCKAHEAVGFIQYYYIDTGALIEDVMGPVVCEACSDALCASDDETTIDELDSET
jgi:hypothetical protein